MVYAYNVSRTNDNSHFIGFTGSSSASFREEKSARGPLVLSSRSVLRRVLWTPRRPKPAGNLRDG